MPKANARSSSKVANKPALRVTALPGESASLPSHRGKLTSSRGRSSASSSAAPSSLHSARSAATPHHPLPHHPLPHHSDSGALPQHPQPGALAFAPIPAATPALAPPPVAVTSWASESEPASSAATSGNDSGGNARKELIDSLQQLVAVQRDELQRMRATHGPDLAEAQRQIKLLSERSPLPRAQCSRR